MKHGDSAIKIGGRKEYDGDIISHGYHGNILEVIEQSHHPFILYKHPLKNVEIKYYYSKPGFRLGVFNIRRKQKGFMRTSAINDGRTTYWDGHPTNACCISHIRSLKGEILQSDGAKLGKTQIWFRSLS